jgi:ABC-type branched-subunit amino acid transport system ATPase component
METGRMVLAGPGAELLEHPHLKEAYFGEGAEGL